MPRSQGELGSRSLSLPARTPTQATQRDGSSSCGELETHQGVIQVQPLLQRQGIQRAELQIVVNKRRRTATKIERGSGTRPGEVVVLDLEDQPGWSRASRIASLDAAMTTKLHTLRPRRFLARLRLTSEVRFGFFHGGVLRGLVSRALGQHELPAGVVPVVCEAGRVRFEAGSAYHLGLTLVGEPAAEAGSWTERLEAGLARIGAGREAGGSSSARSGTPARLEGNFRVEAVDELPVPGLPGQLEALCRSIGARASEASRETEPRSSDGASNGDLSGRCSRLSAWRSPWRSSCWACSCSTASSS